MMVTFFALKQNLSESAPVLAKMAKKHVWMTSVKSFMFPWVQLTDNESLKLNLAFVIHENKKKDETTAFIIMIINYITVPIGNYKTLTPPT